MNHPSVSVIIPVHNGLPLVIRAITSALAQSEQSLEILVCDDASTDRTVDEVERMAVDDNRIRLLRSCPPASGGPARPRNRGLAAARGDYIAMLDHDDVWAPEKLALQIERLCATRADVCFTRCWSDDATHPGSEQLDYHDKWFPWLGAVPEGDLSGVLIRADIIPCCTAIFRRSLVEKIGGFHEELVAIDDYDFWLRAALAGATFCAVDTPLATYRWEASSLSHRSKHRQLEMHLRMWQKLAEQHPDDRRVKEAAKGAANALASARLLTSTSGRLAASERVRIAGQAIRLRPSTSVYVTHLRRLARVASRRGRARAAS